MAERNRPAVGIDLDRIGSQLSQPREHHRRECLVDLHRIDVIN